MRWISYFILAYVALAIQVGAGPYLRWNGASPNFVLLAVIFLAVNAPREPALLGCLGLGFMQDLLTQSPLGLYMLAYGLVGMFVVSTQQIVYREHPLTHFSLALMSGMLTAAVLLLQGLIHRPGPGAWGLVVTTIYTALLSPLVLAVLQRLSRAFAFQPTRRSLRGL